MKNTKVYQGKPCGRCASTERLVSTGRCRACNNFYGAQNIRTRDERNLLRGRGACAICYGTMDQPCYDEANGIFRGWLCHACNLMLGHAKDDPMVLRDAADYLDRHRGG